MARGYSASGNATNATSTTLPMLSLTNGGTQVQPRVKRVFIGFDAAPAASAFLFKMQRCTTVGTPGSTPTPQCLFAPNATGPTSACAFNLAVFSGTPPTLTSNAFLLTLAVNQSAFIEWLALEEDLELAIPAVANSGLALMSVTVGGIGAVDSAFELHFVE